MKIFQHTTSYFKRIFHPIVDKIKSGKAESAVPDFMNGGIFLEILQIVMTASISIAVLFVVTKLMGDRQISQLSMFDYINGITIGSIAAEMATSLDGFVKPLIALLVYSIMTMIVAMLTNKSIKLRRFFTGRAYILYDNGQFYFKNFKHVKMDIGEFLTECRIAGYFDLSNLQSAILEPNGRMSFVPNSHNRPVSPKDMGIPVVQEEMLSNIVLDGQVLEGNLKRMGLNEQWLKAKLKEQGAPKIEEMMLVTCDRQNNLTWYTKTQEKHEDTFE